MVEFKDFDEFYTTHYLPTLLDPRVDLRELVSYRDDDILKIEEAIADTVNGDYLDYERISYPDEVYALAVADYIVSLTKDSAKELLKDWSEYLESDTFDRLVEKYIDRVGDYGAMIDFALEVLSGVYGWDRYDMLNDLEEVSGDYLDEYTDEITDRVLIYNYVYEPEVFDPKTAIKVGLIPFSVYDNGVSIDLLSIGGAGMDLSPLLDAYQLFVDNSIRRNSYILNGNPDNWKYFRHVVGDDVYRKVVEILMQDGIVDERWLRLSD